MCPCALDESRLSIGRVNDNILVCFTDLALTSLSVFIDSIKEVRVGKNTDVLRNKDIAGIYPDECAFSIIYSDDYDSLDLIANSPDEANIWVTGLTCLISGKCHCKYLNFMGHFSRPFR